MDPLFIAARRTSEFFRAARPIVKWIKPHSFGNNGLAASFTFRDADSASP
jgi:hypothetical protein